MTLGESIQTKRAVQGLSQEKLAELVGVSRQAVSKWEVGDAVPDTDKLVPLAQALGCSVDELLGHVPPVPPAGPAGEKPRGPGWFALHWYWLGLIPAAWGAYRAIQGVVSVFQMKNQLNFIGQLLASGFTSGEDEHFQRFFTQRGEVIVSEIVKALLPVFLAAGGAVLVGLLIFFLGRRYVRRKCGGTGK